MEGENGEGGRSDRRRVREEGEGEARVREQ